MKNLEELVEIGNIIANSGDRYIAHERFANWVDEVRAWLAETLPESGVSAEWSALGVSDLLLDNSVGSAREEWEPFHEMIQNRLIWLSALQKETLSLPVTQALRLAIEIDRYHFCGPSDDPDEQTAVIYGFKHLAKRFAGTIKLIPDFDVPSNLNFNVESIYEVYDLHSDLQVVIDTLRLFITKPLLATPLLMSSFIEKATINELKNIQDSEYDIRKIVQYCEEINSSYCRGNLMSVMLLLRALLNHIPPIFGKHTFKEVVAHSRKSVKEILQPLEEIARDIADHHTHSTIRHNEPLPTTAQVDPFRPNVEFLIHEIAIELKRMS